MSIFGIPTEFDEIADDGVDLRGSEVHERRHPFASWCESSADVVLAVTRCEALGHAGQRGRLRGAGIARAVTALAVDAVDVATAEPGGGRRRGSRARAGPDGRSRPGIRG